MKEQRNLINRLINRLKRATTEEEKIMLYTFFHDDLLEALVDVHVLLTNLIRLESATLKDEDEIIKTYYKNKIENHENDAMYQKTIDTYKLLAKSWVELSGNNEKQAVMDGCKLAFSSTKSILRDE